VYCLEGRRALFWKIALGSCKLIYSFSGEIRGRPVRIAKLSFILPEQFKRNNFDQFGMNPGESNLDKTKAINKWLPRA
jgi:hypothetical protein